MKALIIKTFIRLFALLPLRLNHLIGAVIGKLMFYFDTRNKRIALINVQTCFPDKDLTWQLNLVKQSLIEATKAVTELGPIWHWHIDKLSKLVVEVKGLDIVEKAKQKKKGIIIVGLHFGAWELAGTYYQHLKPMTFLYTLPKLKALDQTIRDGRARYGVTLAPPNTRGVMQIIKVLKKGETIGLLPDQIPANGAGIISPFYGTDCYTMTFLSKLSKKTGATIIFSLLERLPNSKGYIKHYIKPDDAIYDEDVQVSVDALNQQIEKCISINPSQYLWSYKRFKQIAESQSNIY